MSKSESLSLLETMNEIVNIRSYDEEQIPQQVEDDLLYAFSIGPSSGNAQPWELLVVENETQRLKVVEATLGPDLTKDSYGGQEWVKDAPFVCVVMLEKRRAFARIGERGYMVGTQDIAFAIQNFRLMAQTHQLRTACVRELDLELLKKKLELPWYLEPVAILTAGYGNREKGLPPRLGVAEIVKRGSWF
ncbi:nitroreductase family protein [Bacillus sp. 522_BSPC]|uniref:nitroreductase family protein n=1 Tax=Bacillus sp. 522_BSPC TaxID=1579338 RepID=UPI000660F099|nr:nitroreductase family protein [Bacillus sp. 522_BSPC]REB73244.1 hypothetical protein CP883_11395 [Cutibacterium acnes]